MNSPPPLDVLKKLANSPLTSVAFGLYVAHLTFENGNRLSMAAPFRFASNTAIQDSPVCEFPLRETNLVRLLGEAVHDVECDPDGTLDLVFKNRDRLIIYANDPMYEAYTLIIDGTEFVV